jgi:hypothetical protein
MSVVKSFNVIPTFKNAASRALVHHMPSDMIFTVGQALWDKSQKSKTYAQKEAYRKMVDEVVKVVMKIRNVETKYHG